MRTPRPQDLLVRAIEVHGRFVRGELGPDARTVLDEHADLAEFLAPLLEEDDAAGEGGAGEGGAGEGTPDEAGETALPRGHPTEIGDFELVRELGRGGMGVVYEAVQKSLGRRVALKLLPPSHTASARAIARFHREAALAAGLDHPGVAKVHCLEEVQGQFHLAMALIDGVSLDVALAGLADRPPHDLTAADLQHQFAGPRPDAGPPPSWRGRYVLACIDLARQVAEALEHAHGRGVVHRDVKPGNILIAADGHAVLTDFGLARGDFGPGVTRSGEFAGTYHYASPEQIRGGAVDARSDVFSMGVTLYEMLALRRPFEADSVAELQRRIERDQPTDVRRHNRSVDRNLTAVVERALEKNPAHRYQTAGEFAADLARAGDGAPVRARPVPWPTRCTRWAMRNPVPASFAAVLLLGTLTVSVLAAVASSHAARAEDALSKYHDLRVGALLGAVELRAGRAHPAVPAQAGELTELVALAEAELLPSIARHEATMAELRRGHVRDGTSPRHPERGAHPAIDHAASLEGLVVRLSGENRSSRIPAEVRAATAAEIAAMTAEAAALRAEIAASDRVWIDDAQDRFLYDELERQHFALRRFRDVVYPDLVFRRELARSVATTTLEQPAAAWRDAAARVAADPRFAGMQLTPQVGLVPLGPDPQSGLEEFAHAASGVPPTRGADGALELDQDSALVLALLPGGTALAFDWAGNPVRLDPFFLAKHEMSRGQWERLARGLPGLRLRDGGYFDVRNSAEPWKPANTMTWTMCETLMCRAGLTLPTEAQWVHALELGRVPATDVLTAEVLAAWARQANLRDQSYGRGREDLLPFDDGFAGLAGVHTMEPNAIGLHHMLGNVSEWCADPHHPGRAPLRDGDGQVDTATWPSAMRTIRGASWNEADVTAARGRDWSAPGDSARNTGLRPARALRTGDR